MFKSLRLRRTQKEDLAALWYGWKKRRHSLNQEFAAALSLLSSLPSRPPWEHPLLAAWGAQPDAAVPACTPPQSSWNSHVRSLQVLGVLAEGEECHRSEDAYAMKDSGGPVHGPPSSSPGGLEAQGACLVRDMQTRCQQRASDACEPGGLPECSERGPGVALLGESGEGMAAAQRALSALIDVHHTDDLMLHDYAALVLLGTWGISQVPLPRCAA